jgi:hypothetical protein
MAGLDENGITRIVTWTGINLGSATKQGLWTVPPGYKFVPDHALIRDVNGNASAATLSMGGNANADDWISAAAMTNLNTSGDAVKLHKRGVASGSMAAEESKVYNAGDIFGVKPGTTAAFTVNVDVFGYLIAT